MLLASVVVAASTAAVSVGVTRSTSPYSWPALVSEVQANGEGAVLTNPLAAQIGVDDPTTAKVLHYPEAADKLARSVFVSQKQHGLKTGEDTLPQLVILVTERRGGGVIERRYMRLGDGGRLEQATLIRDKVDADGAVRPGGRTVESVPVDKAGEWLEHERDFYFRGKYRRQKEAR